MNENEIKYAGDEERDGAMSYDDVRENILNRYLNDGEESSGNYSDAENSAEDEQPAESTDIQGEIGENESANGLNYDETMNFAKSRDRAEELERENERLRRELEESKNMRIESALSGESVNSTVNSMPELNLDEMLYASDEDRSKMLADYNKKLIELAAKQATADMLGRVEPLIKQYDAAAVENEINSALDELSSLDGWGDVKERSNEIRRLSSREEFASMNPTQRMAIAALIDKGLRASEKKAPDLNAMADEVMANPELMKIITAKNAREVQSKNVNIPVHSAGGGFGTAAFSVSEKPSSFDEVREKYGLV